MDVEPNMQEAMGPLNGIRVVEMAGLGPAPFCGMMLADHGADVIRIDRPGATSPMAKDARTDVLNRSRRSLTVDLKQSAGVHLVRKLVGSADGLIEGFRPGVMERLGLGPDLLLCDNPRLVYGRMTGWGQQGPYAQTAGHDINYIALSGALHGIGRSGDKPVAPLNLVGDFGGGGMMLAFGLLAAMLHARTTGEGQVVDCAMTDGSAVLMAMMYSARSHGMWSDVRGANLLDSGSPFYDTYQTKDGGFISVGAIEPQFYRKLLDVMELSAHPTFQAQYDRTTWSAQREVLEQRFLSRSRADWCSLFAGGDACFAPVLSMQEAPDDIHNAVRRTFVEVQGLTQPAPAQL